MEMNIYKIILKTIYTTFESELTKIYEKVNAIYPLTYKTFRDDMLVLEQQDCCRVVSINIGTKGGKRCIVLKTEAGENLALRFFDSILQEREAELLLREHTSLEHGYFNKYCVDILREAGFDVRDRYEDNRFVTSLLSNNGNKLVCESDFHIEYNNKTYLFEGETGKCMKENTHQKLDKELNLIEDKKIAKTVFIVCPSKKAVDKTQAEVNAWYSSKSSSVYNTIDVKILNASMKENLLTEAINCIKNGVL